MRIGRRCYLCGMYHDTVWYSMFGAVCQACFNDPPPIRMRVSNGHVIVQVVYDALPRN